MRILINGLPLFGKKLAEELQNFDAKNKYLFLDTYNSNFAKVKFFFLMPFFDCLISMNGVTENSGSLNWVLKCKKKLILQWMGTDVLTAGSNQRNNRIDRKYIDYGVNWVDAKWLLGELSFLNVPLENVIWKSIDVNKNTCNFEKVQIMSYIAQNRQDFYGMQRIILLAHEYPEIQFVIHGTKKCDYSFPNNVSFRGWTSQDDFQKELSESIIFLRLVDHDGLSISVLEALGSGCEVIWSMENDFTRVGSNHEMVKQQIEQILNKSKVNGLKPNLKSIDYIANTYNEKLVLTKLINKIKEVVS